jgi:GT2 family glycosyltransferase
MSLSLSVIVPAFNEELYLPATLKNINQAIDHLQGNTKVELIVVDNDSTDKTPEIARSLGAKVLHEPTHNIGRVRNVGAQAATGEVLVFVDADTLIPEDLLSRISEAMASPQCVGGSVDIDYRPRNPFVRAYVRFWRFLGILFQASQGVTQFCRREIFLTLNGYDESLFNGEDVDFYARLGRYAKKHGGRRCFISQVAVIPSPRRYDRWPLWRILLWTNPLFGLLFRRKKNVWSAWYDAAPR